MPGRGNIRLLALGRQSACEPVMLTRRVVVDLAEAKRLEPARGSWAEVSYRVPAVHDHRRPRGPGPQTASASSSFSGMLTAPGRCCSSYSSRGSTSRAERPRRAALSPCQPLPASPSGPTLLRPEPDVPVRAVAERLVLRAATAAQRLPRAPLVRPPVRRNHLDCAPSAGRGRPSTDSPVARGTPPPARPSRSDRIAQRAGGTRCDHVAIASSAAPSGSIHGSLLSLKTMARLSVQWPACEQTERSS